MIFDEFISSLNADQRKFVDFFQWWTKQSNLAAVVLIDGSAGSGKSYTVFEMMKFYENIYNIQKLALTNKIASLVNGQTIHSALQINYKSTSEHSFHAVEQAMKNLEASVPLQDYVSKIPLAANELIEFSFRRKNSSYTPQIVIIDEAAMINSWLIYSIAQFYNMSCLFILIGDSYQLRPISSEYNIFQLNVLPLLTVKISLTENKRFTRDYNAIIQQMRNCMDRDDKENFYALIRAHFPIRERILDTDLKFINLVLCFKNESVERYNTLFLSQIPGKMVKIPTIKNNEVITRQSLHLKSNCHMIINRGVRKNTPVIFNTYLSEKDELLFADGTILKRSPSLGNFTVELVYSSTIHKYQGSTIEINNIVFDFNGSENLNLIYTGLSRVRDKNQIFAVIF